MENGGWEQDCYDLLSESQTQALRFCLISMYGLLVFLISSCLAFEQQGGTS